MYPKEIFQFNLPFKKTNMNNEHSPFLDPYIYNFNGNLNTKFLSPKYWFSNYILFPRHHRLMFTYLNVCIWFWRLLLKNQRFQYHNIVKLLPNAITGARTSFVNINQRADFLCVQYFTSHLGFCYILYKGQKLHHSHQTVTKP